MPAKTKSIYRYLLFGAGFLAFIYYMETHTNQFLCNEYNQYLKISFNGIVIKKFVDPNEHSFPYIYIGNDKKKNDIEKLSLFNDTTAYNYIHLNDTVVKFKDDPWIYKKTNSKLLKLTLINYGCINSTR